MGGESEVTHACAYSGVIHLDGGRSRSFSLRNGDGNSDSVCRSGVCGTGIRGSHFTRDFREGIRAFIVIGTRSIDCLIWPEKVGSAGASGITFGLTRIVGSTGNANVVSRSDGLVPAGAGTGVVGCYDGIAVGCSGVTGDSESSSPGLVRSGRNRESCASDGTRDTGITRMRCECRSRASSKDQRSSGTCHVH